MIYILNLIISILIFCLVYKTNYKNSTYTLAAILVICLWTLLLGSQDNVGADYSNYLTMFQIPRYIDYYTDVKAEYGFYFIITKANALGFYGQDLFYIFVCLTSIVFFKIASLVSKKDVVILIFLFITMSTLFHYQMNALRQSLAVVLLTLAFIYLLKNKKVYFLILILLAASIHKSALFMLPLYFIPLYNFSNKNLFSLLIISSFIAFLPMNNFIDNILGLTDNFSDIADYTRYQGADYVQDLSLLNKLTKVIYLPLYMYALYFYSKSNRYTMLNSFEIKLFQFGMICFCLRNLCLISTISYRLGLYLLLLSIFPIFFLMRDLRKTNYIRFYSLIILFILFTYFLKVCIFPEEVYSYSSVLFN